MNKNELLDEVGLFLIKHHPDIEYDLSLVFATSVLGINKKINNRDFEGILNILVEWYEYEFRTWKGDDIWKSLDVYQITILFMTYFNYWDDRDVFSFNYGI